VAAAESVGEREMNRGSTTDVVRLGEGWLRKEDIQTRGGDAS